MAEQGTFRTTRNCRSGKRDVIVDRSAKRPRRPVVYRVSFKEAEVDASPVLQVHAFGVPANPKKVSNCELNPGNSVDVVAWKIEIYMDSIKDKAAIIGTYEVVS